MQQRRRSVVRKPEAGGKECPALSETQPCGTYPCRKRLSSLSPRASPRDSFSALTERQPVPLFAAVDCVASDWTEWSECSAVCGEGTRLRSRRVLTPASEDPPGLACGPLRQEEVCFASTGACAQDCLLEAWGEWSHCSAVCGEGTRHRQRGVARLPSGGGSRCEGPLYEEEVCVASQESCRKDCLVTDWTEWSECSASCQGPDGKGGSRVRQREVLRLDSHGGAPCPDSLFEEDKNCNADVPCPVDCAYSPWSDWSTCEGSCGIGASRRERKVLSEAKFGGAVCGATEEVADCMLPELCEENCLLGEWSEWSACSASCGGGYRRRSREVKVSPASPTGAEAVFFFRESRLKPKF